MLRIAYYCIAIATDGREAYMDRDFDGDFDGGFDGSGIDLDASDRVFTLPVRRINPGSVAEMLAILADRMSLERPLTDAELEAKYPESDIDEDEKWDDRDPAYQHQFDD